MQTKEQRLALLYDELAKIGNEVASSVLPTARQVALCEEGERIAQEIETLEMS